jgi:DNA-binding CsgD family transcriptional regulator
MTLQAISGAPDYFSRVSDVIGRIGDGVDETEFVFLLREATARIGASASYFLSFVREDETFASYRFLLACDPLWGLEYDNAGCHSSDPWLRHAMRHSGPFRSSEIPCTNEQEQAVVRLAATFGFRSAVVVPASIGGGESRLGILVLGSAEPGYFDGEGYGHFKVLARVLAMELHERFIALIRSELLVAGEVTDQELDLLRHERDGRCSKTIARLMGISQNAVDRRFYRLNGKLRSPNRKVSMRLAVEYGLI